MVQAFEVGQETWIPERREIAFTERTRGYIALVKSEDIAEFDYRPGARKRPYRVVVVRKNLTIERGGIALFDDCLLYTSDAADE